jgi:hypothetical protein
MGGVPEMGQHLRYVDRSAGKKVFQRLAVRRRFRMKRKGRPVRVDIKFLLQFFNTPGNEIAPGSDIVREDFQDLAVRHGYFLFLAVAVTCHAADISGYDHALRKTIEIRGIHRSE